MIIVASQFDDPPLWIIAAVLGLTGWAWGARVLRAQTMSLRNRDFIQAAMDRYLPLLLQAPAGAQAEAPSVQVDVTPAEPVPADGFRRVPADFSPRVTVSLADFMSLKQAVAMTAGGVMGSMCLAGLLILLHRRLTNARVSAVTRAGDKVLLLWLLVTLLLGLSTIFESAGHMDGHMMVLLMTWAQHVVTLRGDAASFVADAPLLFKAHLFMGMSLFVIFPFTRLVHVWSGFASVGYLGRAWQLVRSR